MTIMFDHSQCRTLDDVHLFVRIADVFITQPVCPKSDRAQWVRSTLLRFSYRTLSRDDRGLLRQYLRAMTGYSAAQLNRHVRTCIDGKPVARPHSGHAFHRRFTQNDIALLAETDNLHGRLNGAATRKICRQMLVQGDGRFSRLATISIGHLYNLRTRERYRDQACTFEKTRAVQVPIGERRKPEPDERPGYIRVDSVHQGDKGGHKGVYHIDLVDEVTQWQVLVAVETIAEAWIVPALEEALTFFPFVIRNFHSDNGSEYINKTVAGLLQKLLITQTKSRARHSNDNGLVESKNGSVVRKYFGYSHIPQPFAARINQFYREHLVPYLNFHRPSGFAVRTVSADGKVTVRYPTDSYQTPYERFLSLSHPAQYLRKGMTLKFLRKTATEKTSNDVARDMQEAKKQLWEIIGQFPSDSPSTEPVNSSSR